jgi:hypothetical protein
MGKAPRRTTDSHGRRPTPVAHTGGDPRGDAEAALNRLVRGNPPAGSAWPAPTR